MPFFYLFRSSANTLISIKSPRTTSADGTERTCRDVRAESASGGKPDLTIATADFRV